MINTLPESRGPLFSLKATVVATILALGFFPVFADIELQTSITDVWYRGTNELTGSITVSINDDDFTAFPRISMRGLRPRGSISRCRSPTTAPTPSTSP